MKNTKEIDKKEGIVKGKSSVSIPMSGFPIDLWQIWNKQCESNYQGIRWVKAWTDHLKAQSFDLIVKSKVMIVKENQEEATKEEKEELGLLNPEAEVKQNE